MVNVNRALGLVAGCMVVLAGCSSKGQVANETASTPISAPSVAAATAPAPVGGEQTVKLELATQKDAAAPGELANIIYFETDSASVRADYQDDIERHAKMLLDNPKAKILLEGHADERGTREYNLALGERRAYAVKQMLISRGVAKKQIEVVSFGEEKPLAEGHGEDAWKENRRAVFVDSGN